MLALRAGKDEVATALLGPRDLATPDAVRSNNFRNGGSSRARRASLALPR